MGHTRFRSPAWRGAPEPEAVACRPPGARPDSAACTVTAVRVRTVTGPRVTRFPAWVTWQSADPRRGLQGQFSPGSRTASGGNGPGGTPRTKTALERAAAQRSCEGPDTVMVSGPSHGTLRGGGLRPCSAGSRPGRSAARTARSPRRHAPSARRCPPCCPVQPGRPRARSPVRGCGGGVRVVFVHRLAGATFHGSVQWSCSPRGGGPRENPSSSGAESAWSAAAVSGHPRPPSAAGGYLCHQSTEIYARWSRHWVVLWLWFLT